MYLEGHPLQLSVAALRLSDPSPVMHTEIGLASDQCTRQVGHARSDFTRDVYHLVRRDDARAAADTIDAALGDVIRDESVAPVLLTAPR